MAEELRTVRAFISSTFRDMHAERDHLVMVVFPELRERLSLLGLDFYDVDLRWGVPERGPDEERANPWEYCKRWIDRVKPFFICVLGERYGSKPKEHELDNEPNRERWCDLSITELEVRHAVIEQRELYRRSFFYLRATPVPRQETAPDVYDRFVQAEASGKLEALRGAIAGTRRPVRHYTCAWRGDHFENLEAFGEVVLEDLWSGVLRDPGYVSPGVWRDVLGHDPKTDPRYTNEGTPIPESLWRAIVEQARPHPREPLVREREEMAEFARGRLRWFQGRTEELRALLRFVSEGTAEGASRLCCVRAVPGQGKSALLAKLVERLAEIRPNDIVILHFVGATENSADLRRMLLRLTEELRPHAGPQAAAAPAEGTAGGIAAEEQQDLESLRKFLATQLGEYADPKRIVLVIDAVNQLTSGHELTWIPAKLGPQVRVIVSTIWVAEGIPAPAERKPYHRVMAALKARRPEPKWVDVGPLSPPEIRVIVEEYLLEYCKELDRDVKEAICRTPQAGNPLYLLVALQELRTLGGDNMNEVVRDRIRDLPIERPDAVALFTWMLERLERAYGGKLVRQWCSYLDLGRVGMSSRELSGLVGAALGEREAPAALRVERAIRRYLQRRGAQFDFFHGQLQEAVERRYLVENAKAPEGYREPYLLNQDIASYFAKLWQTHAERFAQEPSEPVRRALSELPYHQTQGRMWEQVYATLTDFPFLEAKCTYVAVTTGAAGERAHKIYGGVYELQEDYRRALANWETEPGEPRTRASPKRPIVVTAWVSPTDQSHAIGCPLCRMWSVVSASALGTAVSCPHCQGPLKLNPFTLNADWRPVAQTWQAGKGRTGV